MPGCVCQRIARVYERGSALQAQVTIYKSIKFQAARFVTNANFFHTRSGRFGACEIISQTDYRVFALREISQTELCLCHSPLAATGKVAWVKQPFAILSQNDVFTDNVIGNHRIEIDIGGTSKLILNNQMHPPTKKMRTRIEPTSWAKSGRGAA